MVVRTRDLHVDTDNNARYVSKLGDRRETPVPCLTCRTSTMALDALCDRCADAKALERSETESSPRDSWRLGRPGGG